MLIALHGPNIHLQQQQLSDEDKKILADAHANRDNPEHPAHKDHPKVQLIAPIEVDIRLIDV